MRTFALLMTIVLIILGLGQTPVAQGGFLTFTPIDFPGATSTMALDINDVGEIVGRYVDDAQPPETPKTHGFLLSAGNFTSIDYPHPDVVFTVAAGINSRGDIVGQYRLDGEDVTTIRHGFLVHRGTFTTIDFPNAIFTNALGINPRGDIVGRYCLAGELCDLGVGQAHGFLRRWQGVFETIDVLGAVETHAWKINARGQIVGNYREAGGPLRVYLSRHGSFTSIEFPHAVATGSANGGMNPRGDIVSGYCPAVPCTGQNPNIHGFLRSRQGGFATIDFPHAVRTVAFGINTRGDVVGSYTDTSLKTHGFLLSWYERDGDEDER